MKTAVHVQGRKIHNPAYKTISRILKKTPAYYEMSLYLIKSRLSPQILHTLRIKGRYQTRNGALLILQNNTAYLTLGGRIESPRDLSRLKKIMENSKYEVLMQYPAYPENIKKIEMFNKMLGRAWKKS